MRFARSDAVPEGVLSVVLSGTEVVVTYGAGAVVDAGGPMAPSGGALADERADLAHGRRSRAGGHGGLRSARRRPGPRLRGDVAARVGGGGRRGRDGGLGRGPRRARGGVGARPLRRSTERGSSRSSTIAAEAPGCRRWSGRTRRHGARARCRRESGAASWSAGSRCCRCCSARSRWRCTRADLRMRRAALLGRSAPHAAAVVAKARRACQRSRTRGRTRFGRRPARRPARGHCASEAHPLPAATGAGVEAKAAAAADALSRTAPIRKPSAALSRELAAENEANPAYLRA